MNNSCEFFNESFIENLYPYQFKNNSIYYDINGSNSYSSNGTLITSNIQSLLSLTTSVADAWVPYFINRSNSKIINKNLVRSTSIDSVNLGIEEALTFTPNFRDWTVTGSSKMVVDWIVTPPISPFEPKYGLMFWYKKREAATGSFKFDQIPINSIVYASSSASYQKTVSTSDSPITITLPANARLMKKSKNVLMILDKDNIKLVGTNILPSNERKYFSINEYKAYYEGINKKPAELLFSYKPTSNTQNSSCIFHISEGEAYSYIDKQSIDYKSSIASKTYISPILYDNYRQVYHNLTLNYPKLLETKVINGTINRIPRSNFILKEYRLFKKLCYFLSTFPLLDRTTVSILQHKDISDIVTEFIGKSVSSAEQEEKLVYDTLIKITPYFKDLHIPETYFTEEYLPKKLIQKYGAKLRLSGDCGVRYKHELTDGPHLKVNSNINCLCEKSLTNTFIYNNTKIKVGNLSIDTLIDDLNSSLVLSDTNNQDEKKLIPLWDIIKKDLINNDVFFSTGPDVEINYNDPDTSVSIADISSISKNGAELAFTLDRPGLSELENTILDGSDVNVEWTRIGGSDCLRFGDAGLTTIRDSGGVSSGATSSGAKFISSGDQQPTIFVKKPGKYRLQCRIDSNFGVFVDTVDLYIVGTSEKKDDKDTSPVFTYTRQASDLLRSARFQNISQKDKNIIILPNFKEFIVGKQGVFWPLYSDLSILQPFKFDKEVAPGIITTAYGLPQVKPLGSPLNKFAIPMANDNESSEPAYFSINFQCRNLIIDIDKIILSHIFSSNHPECEPVYRCANNNKLFDMDLIGWVDVIDPKTNKLLEAVKPNTIKTETVDLSTLPVENQNQLVPILFGPGDLNKKLQFDTFSYSEDIYAKRTNANLESVDDGSGKIICYEDIPDESDQNYQKFKDSMIIKLDKGYLHPASGWLPSKTNSLSDKYKNKTSIVTGDHSKRKCKTFRGVGFDNLQNAFFDGKSSVYSSQITLSMDKPTYDCDGEDCDTTKIAEIDKEFYENGEKPEIHDINYGYHNPSMKLKSIYKYSDELDFFVLSEPDGPVQSSEYCVDTATENAIQNSIEYIYSKPGPKYTKSFNSAGGILYDRSFGRDINNIEVRLNFLNHINPKELVIWLEIRPCGNIARKLKPTKGSPPDLYPYGPQQRSTAVNYINSLENKELKKYLVELFKINDSAIPSAEEGAESEETEALASSDENLIEAAAYDPNYALLLLNQDHIDFSVFNNKIKFTDNTKYTANNLNNTTFLTNNNFVSRSKDGTIEIQPTRSAPNYSDSDIYKFQEIIKTNNFSQYLFCNLSKFNRMPLFKPPTPEGDDEPPVPENIDSTAFTLKIAVLGEIDDGNVYDRIIGYDNILNINNVKIKNTSNILTNSLCSWDLILGQAGENNFEDKDVLGQIDYTSSSPKFDGYNFIGKIPPYLMPPVNLNAPHLTTRDLKGCFYRREALTSPRPSQIPTLPFQLLNYIPSFTIVGELVNAASLFDQMNNQAREFAGYFNDLRRIRQLEEFNRNIFIPKFETVEVGSSNKALISISKDKQTWFKLEAGILRYNNCPIMRQKVVAYKKIHYLNELRQFAIFPLIEPTSIDAFLSYYSKSITLNQYVNVSIETIITKEYLQSLKNQILLAQAQVNNLLKNNQQIPEALSNSLEAYKEMFVSIGPAGIEEDDIIKFIDMDGLVKYYSIQKDVILRATEFTDLYTLLINNKILFTKNNLISVLPYLKSIVGEKPKKEDPETTEPVKNDSVDGEQKSNPSEEEEEEKEQPDGYVYILNGLRPYFIYPINEAITAFTPKTELSDGENQQISKIQQQIDKINIEIQKINGSKDTTDTEKSTQIKEKKKQILALSSQIFMIQHNQSFNNIKAKGYIFINDSFYTIFILNAKVDPNTFLVITPEQNRVILYDKNYTYFDGDSADMNRWIYSNSNDVFNNTVIDANSSIFNKGMYGSGAISNDSRPLYNPERTNFIRNFIEEIGEKLINSSDVSESCTILTTTQEETTEQPGADGDASVDSDIMTTTINGITYNIANSSIKNIYLDNIFGNLEKYNSFNIAKINNNRDKLNILDNIMGIEKYNAFFKNMKLKFILEGDIQVSSAEASDESGLVVVNRNNSMDYSYLLVDKNKTRISLDILKNRLLVIIQQIKNNQKKIKNNLSRINDSNSRSILQQNTILIGQIDSLKDEYNRLAYYIEKCDLNIIRENVLPNIYAIYYLNSDGSIFIKEEPLEDYYVFNIDKDQRCSIDYSRLPKILRGIKYNLIAVGAPGAQAVDTYRFFGEAFGFKEDLTTTKFFVKKSVAGEITYSLTPDAFDAEKGKMSGLYPNLDWDTTVDRTYDRIFYLNGNGMKGIIIKAIYTYSFPNTSNVTGPDPSSRVHEILDLDNDDEVYIDFKKIPRNLKGEDNYYDRYTPNIDGYLTKSLVPAPYGPIDNTPKMWRAIYEDTGLDAPLPINFKWMNLMRYIAFYNTYLLDDYGLDLNQNLLLVRSRDEMELIPYDYS